MAKKKQEDPPKGSPAWMATFSDLMNLLLCFFVLLFSMATVDAAKFELVVNSLRSAFSVLPSGGETVAEGELIGGGIMAMPEYSNNFGDTLDDTEGNEIEDGTDTTMQEGGGTDNETDTQQGPGMDDGETSQTNESTSTEQTSQDSSQQQQNQDSQQSQQEQQGQQGQDNQQGQQGQDNQQGQQSQESVSTSEAQEVLDEEALKESKEMAEQIEALTTFYGIQNNVQIDYNGQFVRLTLNGSLLFDSGSADIKEQAIPIVDNVGHILDNYPDNLIEVEGHTDNVPIRSARFESNNVLSMYRALSMADRLRYSSTINPGNIYSAGRGDYKPIADNSTAEGRARNRRVEIKIYNSFNSDLSGY